MSKIKKDLSKFEDYVYAYYGKGGLFSMNATMKQILKAIEIRKQNKAIPFDGDTVDREMVRDILRAKFNLVTL